MQRTSQTKEIYKYKTLAETNQEYSTHNSRLFRSMVLEQKENKTCKVPDEVALVYLDFIKGRYRKSFVSYVESMSMIITDVKSRFHKVTEYEGFYFGDLWVIRIVEGNPEIYSDDLKFKRKNAYV